MSLTLGAIARPLLLTAAACAAACPAGAAAQTVLRPFTAELSGVESLGQDPIRCPLPPSLVGNTQGQGTASLMGPVTLKASDCPIPLDASPLPAGFIFGGGRLTLMATNGHELRAWYRGALKSVPGSPGVYTLEGSYNVVGGSGCFRHALGGGVLKGQVILGPTQALAQYKATGVLLYNRSGCSLAAAFDSEAPGQ